MRKNKIFVTIFLFCFVLINNFILAQSDIEEEYPPITKDLILNKDKLYEAFKKAYIHCDDWYIDELEDKILEVYRKYPKEFMKTYIDIFRLNPYFDEKNLRIRSSLMSSSKKAIDITKANRKVLTQALTSAYSGQMTGGMYWGAALYNPKLAKKYPPVLFAMETLALLGSRIKYMTENGIDLDNLKKNQAEGYEKIYVPFAFLLEGKLNKKDFKDREFKKIVPIRRLNSIIFIPQAVDGMKKTLLKHFNLDLKVTLLSKKLYLCWKEQPEAKKYLLWITDKRNKIYYSSLFPESVFDRYKEKLSDMFANFPKKLNIDYDISNFNNYSAINLNLDSDLKKILRKAYRIVHYRKKRKKLVLKAFLEWDLPNIVKIIENYLSYNNVNLKLPDKKLYLFAKCENSDNIEKVYDYYKIFLPMVKSLVSNYKMLSDWFLYSIDSGLEELAETIKELSGVEDSIEEIGGNINTAVFSKANISNTYKKYGKILNSLKQNYGKLLSRTKYFNTLILYSLNILKDRIIRELIIGYAAHFGNEAADKLKEMIERLFKNTNMSVRISNFLTKDLNSKFYDSLNKVLGRVEENLAKTYVPREDKKQIAEKLREFLEQLKEENLAKSTTSFEIFDLLHAVGKSMYKSKEALEGLIKQIGFYDNYYELSDMDKKELKQLLGASFNKVFYPLQVIELWEKIGQIMARTSAIFKAISSFYMLKSILKVKQDFMGRLYRYYFRNTKKLEKEID